MVAWAVQAGPIPVLRSQEKESVLIRVLNRDRHTKKKGGAGNPTPSCLL